jgi:hypothetical protein
MLGCCRLRCWQPAWSSRRPDHRVIRVGQEHGRCGHRMPAGAGRDRRAGDPVPATVEMAASPARHGPASVQCQVAVNVGRPAGDRPARRAVAGGHTAHGGDRGPRVRRAPRHEHDQQAHVRTGDRGAQPRVRTQPAQNLPVLVVSTHAETCFLSGYRVACLPGRARLAGRLCSGLRQRRADDGGGQVPAPDELPACPPWHGPAVLLQQQGGILDKAAQLPVPGRGRGDPEKHRSSEHYSF